MAKSWWYYFPVIFVAHIESVFSLRDLLLLLLGSFHLASYHNIWVISCQVGQWILLQQLSVRLLLLLRLSSKAHITFRRSCFRLPLNYSICTRKECKVDFCVEDGYRSLSFYLSCKYEKRSVFSVKLEEECTASHKNVRVLLDMIVELKHGEKQSFVNLTYIRYRGILAEIIVFLVLSRNSSALQSVPWIRHCNFVGYLLNLHMWQAPLAFVNMVLEHRCWHKSLQNVRSAVFDSVTGTGAQILKQVSAWDVA